MSRKAINWCFTLNNPTDAEKTALLSFHRIYDKLVQYLVFQEEKGEEEQTPHFQGYMELTSQKRIPYLTKRLHSTRYHFEMRRGSQAQAIAYCKKEDTRVGEIYEFGTPRVDKRRTSSRLSDVKPMVESLRDGKCLREIADSHSCEYVLYGKGLELLYARLQKPRPLRQPEILIMYGKTGTGKSYLARQLFPNAFFFQPRRGTASQVWWDGYQGEQVIVFDEFRNEIPFQNLLRYLDYYPCRVEVKGSSIELQAFRFVFTTNIDPEEWYSIMDDTHNDEDRRGPLFRRLVDFAEIWDFAAPMNRSATGLPLPEYEYRTELNGQFLRNPDKFFEMFPPSSCANLSQELISPAQNVYSTLSQDEVVPDSQPIVIDEDDDDDDDTVSSSELDPELRPSQRERIASFLNSTPLKKRTKKRNKKH